MTWATSECKKWEVTRQIYYFSLNYVNEALEKGQIRAGLDPNFMGEGRGERVTRCQSPENETGVEGKEGEGEGEILGRK